MGTKSFRLIDTYSLKRRVTPIGSIIVADMTRKEFGDINSLSDSISSVGLLQPIVIKEKNELIDGRHHM
jgi:ParB-like nuclease family protein